MAYGFINTISDTAETVTFGTKFEGKHEVIGAED